METETTTFIDCFRNTDLRRTIIAIMVYAIQPLVANFLVIGYAVDFFELAGLATSDAFNLGVGLLGVGFIGACLSWLLIGRFGHRPIYNYGLCILTVLVLLVSVLDVAPGPMPHDGRLQFFLRSYNWTIVLRILDRGIISKAPR
jgi:hypothetical protein